MSQPDINAEIMEMQYELRKEIAREVGMVFSGHNIDGEPEFIGTEKQWNEYTKLLEQKLNNE